MLHEYRQHLTKVRYCIDENQHIVSKIIEDAHLIFMNAHEQSAATNCTNTRTKLRNQDLEKVQVVLKQFVRDWSSEGEAEREQCYAPLIAAVQRWFGGGGGDVGDIKILMPGAGLGRLTYELASRGYYCEGNEFSYFMLIASNFVLNKCTVENQYTIYPWVHQYVNNACRADQTRAVRFPDVSPFQAPPPSEKMNMVAGDFLEVYQAANYWDCVVTCFFIDCANNVAAFVENIFQ